MATVKIDHDVPLDCTIDFQSPGRVGYAVRHVVPGQVIVVQDGTDHDDMVLKRVGVFGAATTLQWLFVYWPTKGVDQTFKAQLHLSQGGTPLPDGSIHVAGPKEKNSVITVVDLP